MTNPPFIGFDDMDSRLTWNAIMDAITAGHLLPRAEVADGFAYRDDDTLLSRSAWVNGLGIAVKAATIFPKLNPSINGGVMLFDDTNGTLRATLDFHLVTKWKTVGDSLLGAKLLARSDSKRLLILGAGTVSGSLVDAYRTLFPDIQISIWNRTAARARDLAEAKGVAFTEDLEASVRSADSISSATMTTDPVIKGEWLQPGQHVDLIGAYRPDMREADDETLTRARIFVDNRSTTMDHIGELKDPLARGVIAPKDVLGDYYDIAGGDFKRQSRDEITLFKNGGGAHLDLMVSDAIYREFVAGH
jgi:ornithine cyclodeaminase